MVASRVPEMAGVATLVAVMTMALLLGTLDGGVYRPVAEMVPEAALPPAVPLIAQVTDWFCVPATAAEYWAGVPILTVAGPVTVTEVAAPSDAWRATVMMPEMLESAARVQVVSDQRPYPHDRVLPVYSSYRLRVYEPRP